MCFALGFYEALLGLLNPADQGVGSLDLQFHLQVFEFMYDILTECSSRRQTFHPMTTGAFHQNIGKLLSELGNR